MIVTRRNSKHTDTDPNWLDSKRDSFRRKVLALSVTVGYGAMCAVAMGNDAAVSTSAADTAGNSGQLEEIVVTAQRRSESMQEVPITVSTISGETALATGITTSTSLNGRVPSLIVSNQGPGDLLFLRGVGSANTSVTGEQSVATYIDGIYQYPGGNGDIAPIYEINRIEVLNGPQGTLFGRDATAGVIQIITRDPTPTPAIESTVGYANYATVSGTSYLTGGNDKIASNLAITFQNQGDGWGYNPIQQYKAFWADYKSARLKTFFTPTEDTTVKVGLYYDRYNSSGFEGQTPPGVLNPAGQISTIGRYEFIGDGLSRSNSNSYTGSIEVDQQLGFGKLVSISAYHKLDFFYPSDADYSPAIIVNAQDTIYAHNFSQEVQLLSPDGAWMQWIVGAFYFNALGGYRPIFVQGTAVGPTTSSTIDEYGSQKTESESLFAQATKELIPGTKLTIGVRDTQETIERVYASLFVDGVFAESGDNEKTDYNTPTWRVALEQALTPDLRTYASYSRGTKTGGYNVTSGPANLPPFLPEKLDDYEVGLKSEFFDNRAHLNFAGFWYRYSNIQVNTTLGPSILVQNAAKATIKGVDSDFEVIPFKNFTVSGAIGYTDGTFDSFPNAVAYPAAAGPSYTIDAAGKTVPYVMRWAGNVGAKYIIPSDVGNFAIDGIVIHGNKVYVGADNGFALPQYNVTNVSWSWTSMDERKVIRLWANNLFDTVYLAAGYEGGEGNVQYPAPPRTYGVTFSYKTK
jgi:iron complex outermembrane receptor protein